VVALPCWAEHAAAPARATAISGENNYEILAQIGDIEARY
jgi:hypothetical protein